MSARSRANRRSIPSRNTFTATDLMPSSVVTVARCTCAIEAAATGSPKLSNSVSIFAPNAASMMPIAVSTIHRRHSILQPLEFERDFRPDDVGPRRQKLPHLDVGRAETVDGAGKAGETVDIPPGDKVRERERQTRNGRQQNGIDVDEGPLSSEDEACVRQPEAVAERGDDRHQSDLPARVDGDDSAAQTCNAHSSEAGGCNHVAESFGVRKLADRLDQIAIRARRPP